MWDHIPKIYNWSEENRNYLIGMTNSLLSFGQLFACLFNGFLMQKYGRRIALILGHFICMIGSLSTFFIVNTPLMMFGRFLQGVSQGIIITSMPLFNIEISPNEYRGTVGGIQSSFFGLGLIISFLFGLGLKDYNENQEDNYWRFILAIPFIFSSLSLLGFLGFVRQDSLLFLYQKYKDNEKFLINKFKIYLTENQIKLQIALLKQAEAQQQNTQKLSVIILFSKKYKMPVLIGLMFFLTPHLNGIDILNIYSSEIINKYDSRYIANIFTILIAVADFISCFLSLLIINKFGRKNLYMIGQQCLAFIIILYVFLSYNDYKSYLKYILVLYKFTYGIFLANILILYTSEILPAVGISLINTVALVIQFGLSQTFPTLISSDLQVEGIFLIFSIFSIIFVIIAKFYMKETKNIQIQDLANLYN
ncbi:major facilitator superfamily protein, putative [Ichthyophthirius multifiliis]|uniref:Major facilitator superfamily protein, putative n=1 Tax=Ichthyophthirius multifiliis TaxID=5932 RepID=G0QPV2_ICHMU|nr:major facilitator superfamily protein, putative [Ichthyophthirius multifiliis]EGR32751.1 major facilitator superfamily protein, putative [Ichthyophthirius multifiliis]|eukprot:XP_004036737.1 major facilitator superfamily protein, putative [Ichthyophthirius multifiliis]